jgi:hypothetical protein
MAVVPELYHIFKLGPPKADAHECMVFRVG